MKGYYNNKKATEKAIDHFGWFNTEDLGYINPATGDLFINGRAKDTVRLLCNSYILCMKGLIQYVYQNPCLS